ncbi:hypothetical protein AAW14_25075 [Streptomyces hygroscopicus]|uniref:carbohydrate kinase family protein n=1 Tax=Streptomyces hygroscopicus TaxID=1912 RepID=UPI00223F39CC|nr:carbohydrate kinase family protein [Streptomyces hygroscopicus]MCW7945187.1 hypothetical protein [Streptomyces hygroscopicus]
MLRDSEVDVIFAGEVFCDLVFGGTPHLPTPGSEVYADRFAVSAGGTATRCVAAARLGLRTGLFGILGTDMFGDRVAAELGAVDGLDLRWLRRDPAVHTPITVAVANEHDRAFITYEEKGSRLPETWHGPLPRVGALHLGIDRPLPDWVRELRAQGTVVVGGVAWDPTGLWSSELLTRLSEVDLFVPNAVEAMSYTRTGTVEEAAKVLADFVPQVVVTDGKDGAVAVDSATGDVVRSASPSVEVADPTGAGDVFTAAYIHAVLKGWPLAARLRFAGICAAVSVRTLGGASSAPTWADIRTFAAATPGVSDQDRALIETAMPRTTLREKS